MESKLLSLLLPTTRIGGHMSYPRRGVKRPTASHYVNREPDYCGCSARVSSFDYRLLYAKYATPLTTVSFESCSLTTYPHRQMQNYAKAGGTSIFGAAAPFFGKRISIGKRCKTPRSARVMGSYQGGSKLFKNGQNETPRRRSAYRSRIICEQSAMIVLWPEAI